METKRELWVRRPVLWLLAAYSAGLIVSLRLSLSPVLILILMAISVSVGIMLRKKAMFPILLILILFFGCLRGAIFLGRENPLAYFKDVEVSMQGTVKGPPQLKENRAIYVLETNAVKAGVEIYPVRARVKVSVYPDTFGEESIVETVYRTGDFLQVTGTLQEPTGPRNPKGFDYRGYLARRHIYSIISIKEKDVQLLNREESFSLDKTLADFRERASQILDYAVGGKEGSFLKAVLLGQRWLIEPDAADDFTRTGLAHILAISGLHVGYLVMLLNMIRSLFRIKRRIALPFQAVFLILYCLMTGASPSVTRAVIMALLYLAGGAFGRKSDIINSAGTAAFLILLIRPMDILEISFQLSFLAVCSIGLFGEPMQKAMRLLPKKLSALLAASLSAQLGTLPLTTYHFNLISPVSVLANLLVIPILGLATAGGFLLIPLGMALPVPARFAAIPVRFLCSLILLITDFAAGLPYAYFRVISPSLFTISIIYLLLWLLSRERPGFVRRPALACMGLIVVLLAGQLLIGITANKELKLVFLDVGQGDCSFIQTPDGKNILIDGGGEPGTDIGNDVLLPFLLKNGVASLDLVIMSHSHDDHISGLQPVLSQLKTRTFMEYPPQEDNPVYLEMKKTIEERGIQVISAARGQSYRIGEETLIHVLHPDPDHVQTLYQDNENNLSLVILMECGDAAVLFTGDIEKGVEYYLAGRMDKRASVLKVPHHGSNTSSTDVFLEVVSPQTAVIQTGTNFFGHPHPEVLDRLESRNIKVYRNDIHGAVILQYHDGSWTIHTMFNDNSAGK